MAQVRRVIVVMAMIMAVGMGRALASIWDTVSDSLPMQAGSDSLARMGNIGSPHVALLLLAPLQDGEVIAVPDGRLLGEVVMRWR